MTPGSLHVAISTDRPLVRWQARCVESIAAVHGVFIDRWIETSTTASDDAGRRDAGALTTVDLPDALLAFRERDPAAPAHAGTLPEPRIDILLDLTTGGVAALTTAATEVWHYAYGHVLGRDPVRAALLGYVRSPGVIRVALVSDPSGTIVREGWLQAVSWWTGKPLERLLTDPADWPAIVAKQRLAGAGSIHAPTQDGESEPTPDRQARRPSLPVMPGRALEVAAVGRRVRGFVDVLSRHPDWNIGIIDAPIEQVSSLAAPSVTWLPLRGDHFSADPFGIERDGVLHVFFEDFDQRTARGAIAHLTVAQDGSVSDPEIVLDPGVHASYPYLIEHEGTVFMLPETSAAGELTLYEAIEFPGRWRPAVTLLPGVPAADASIVEFEGRWWMFATRLDRGANQNLFVWHASTPFGPWAPHALNPVKTDARSARPAGTPYISDGVLHRPSQDNSRAYGGRVVINEVGVLTPDAFAERPVSVIQPWPGSPYQGGLHTLSAVGQRTLMDGNHLHLVRGALRFNLESKLPGRPS
jgi:hypothetical protein